MNNNGLKNKIKAVLSVLKKGIKHSGSDSADTVKFADAVRSRIKKVTDFLKKPENKKYTAASAVLIFAVFLGIAAVFVNGKNGESAMVDDIVLTPSALKAESESETTTAEAKTLQASALPAPHFNEDGRLYGKKGKYSGLWPDLEEKVNQSNASWTVLKEWVGDSSELSKSDYQEDKFVLLNGYGTVHWSQSGHSWQAPYSCADYSTDSAGEEVEGYFEKLEDEDVFIDVGTYAEEDDLYRQSDDSYEYQTAAPLTPKDEGDAELSDEEAAESESVSNEAETETEEGTAEETTAAQQKKAADENSSGQAVEGESEDITEELPQIGDDEITEESAEITTEGVPDASAYIGTGEFDGKATVSVKRTYLNNAWGSTSCGVCSLAMVLSTLSGVTVSPPEVALAANCLIGDDAWYGGVLYSQAQADLAEMAGFTVKTEPYESAKKETMDDCLNKNGMAIFVTDKSAWASGGESHYIAVRNRVGDKYYTCDSGKNPKGGFTYDQIASGYSEQLIVYIYPKGTAY